MIQSNRFKRIILTIASVLATLVCVETLFRVTDLLRPFINQYEIDSGLEVNAAHPFLHHTLVPGLNYLRPAHMSVNIPAYNIVTNSLGFRFDLQNFLQKGPNIFRIAVLGDSFIEGYALEHTLPFLLERKLSKTAQTTAFEVMNWGSMSHSPIIYYVNLRRNILTFRPDLVVVHFDMSDVYDDNYRYRSVTEWDKNSNPVMVHPGPQFVSVNHDGKPKSAIGQAKDLILASPFHSWKWFQLFLSEKLYTAKILQYRLLGVNQLRERYNSVYAEVNGEGFLQHSPKIERLLAWCKDYDSPETQREITFSFSILKKIKDLLKEHNIPLVIITAPIRPQIVVSSGEKPYSRAPIDRLERFCKKYGIPFYSPINEIEKAVKSGHEVYFSDEYHLNYEGVEIWANGVSEFLSRTFTKLSK